MCSTYLHEEYPNLLSVFQEMQPSYALSHMNYDVAEGKDPESVVYSAQEDW